MATRAMAIEDAIVLGDLLQQEHQLETALQAFGELRWLSQQLNLTEEQKEKLRPIVMEEGEQLRVARLDEHVPLDQKRAKMMEIRESFRPKIAAVLTPEQQEKWKKLEANLEGKPPAGAKDPATPAAPQK